jgi:hydrogenase 3 maturation protease
MQLKRLEGCSRIALLGVGCELRGDDAAGLLLVRELAIMVRKRPFSRLQFEGFEGGNAPENATGFIKGFRPSHIIVADAADISLPPGEWREINPEDINGISFSTHTLPMGIITEYLQQATAAAISIIGIQPGNLDFGRPPTEALKRGVRGLSRQLYGIMRECDHGASVLQTSSPSTEVCLKGEQDNGASAID